MADVSITKNRNGFVSPYTPRYREVFYSAVPIPWTDNSASCITCLPCASDTFIAPGTPKAIATSNSTAAAAPTLPSCTIITQPDIVSCGSQNWPSGPESGLPYTNIGDNVTNWNNITQGDFTSDGSNILNVTGNGNVCDTVNNIISNNFSMSGKISVGWDGESGGANNCYWIFTDADKKRAIMFSWSPIPASPQQGFNIFAFCDLAGDFFTNTTVASQSTFLSPNVEYIFSFVYAGGILTLTIDSESISVNLGCAAFGYLAMGGDNEDTGDLALNTISIT